MLLSRKLELHVSLLNDKKRNSGVTLLELLVTLVILSILASAALPYAELSVRRSRELELNQALRDIRNAIDAFHDDWIAGKISHSSSSASEDGYPRNLEILVKGVDTGKADGKRRFYLRKIPRDPFASSETVGNGAEWILRGYQDDPRRFSWNGKDVYDVHSTSPAKAIDGSFYKEW